MNNKPATLETPLERLTTLIAEAYVANIKKEKLPRGKLPDQFAQAVQVVEDIEFDFDDPERN